MDILKAIFLILAYSLGIATLAVQIICYLKDIENIESVFLTISFLLVIISATIQNLFQFENIHLIKIHSIISSILIVVLSLSIAINVHVERIVKHIRTKNLIIYILSAVIVFTMIAFYFMNDYTIPLIIASAFLFVSILYSMFVILFSQPSLLLQHRDKIEKLSALIVLILVTGTSILALLALKYDFWEEFEKNGAFILPAICIMLCLFKLPDDIKRLSDFSQPLEIDPGQLQQFNISPREQDVLLLLIKGKSYKSIGDELFISLPTVKTHVNRIYKKLNVRNRLELSNRIKQVL